MRLWQKLTSFADQTRLGRGLSRAALEGASVEELRLETYRALESVLHGVDRFGVWVAAGQATEQSLAGEEFVGRLWSQGREAELDEPVLHGSSAAFPSDLLAGGPVVEREVPQNPQEMILGPAAGMGKTLWVPVRVDGELNAVLFAGTRNPGSKLPRDEMQRAGTELALALRFVRESAAAGATASELEEMRQLWADFSARAPLEQFLQKITRSCLLVTQRHNPSVAFAVLGILQHEYGEANGTRSPVDFAWQAGDGVLARFAISGALEPTWRRALETGSTTGSEMPSRWTPSEISRVVAVPVRAGGEVHGVLIAGFTGQSATLANLQRLELRANLAGTAIALRTAGVPAGRAREDSLRFFLQNTTEAAFVLDERFRVVSASDTGKQLVAAQLTTDSPSGKPGVENQAGEKFARIFKPAEWLRVASWLERLTESKGHAGPSSIVTELNIGRVAQVRALPLSAGGFAAIVGSNQAKDETAAERAADELASLMDWLEQGILLFDEKESLRGANQRFLQLFALEPGDVREGVTLYELANLIAPRVAESARFTARWFEVAQGLESNLYEEIRVQQPTPRVVERVSRPVLDSAGQRRGRIEIYRDLSAQQLLQARIHKSERLAALGEKVSGVAHELSNPLTTVLGYAERLLRKSVGSPFHDEIQHIFSEAERATAILRQLLGSARDTPLQHHAIDLNEIMQRTADQQQFLLASEKIKLELELTQPLPPVLADPGQIQQILLNLISNSRHALLEQRRGGSIALRSRVTDSGRVTIEVADTGPGIPEAHRHRIFDPFFTTKPTGIGSGLGLSIVMGLVRQNNGSIRLQSQASRGATFVVEFPAAVVVSEIRVPVLPAAFSALPPLATGRVLVVEDEPTVAQLVADMLSDLGYASDALHDARQALVAALSREYLLIICDMKMPGLDGQHFYRALAETGSLQKTKFLFVTGDVLGITSQEFLRKHRLAHIAKPFRMEEFADKLAQVLQGAQAETAPPAATTATLSHRKLFSHG